MHYWKTFKNKWTFEFSLHYRRPTGISLDCNWYSGSYHPGLYILFDVFGLTLDIEFYGPECDN